MRPPMPLCAASVLSLAAIAAALLGAPTSAAACSFGGGISRVFPATDAVHPANAPILAFGGVGPEQLSVTVDGVAAALVEADLGAALAFYEPYLFALRIEPEPAPGQTVVFTYPAGDEDDCGQAICDRVFVAGPADDTPPTAVVEALSFDLIDRGGPAYMECGEPVSGAWWWITALVSEETGYLEVSLVREAAPDAVIRQGIYPWGLESDGGLWLALPWLGVDEDQLAPGDPAADFCLRVRWLDLAFNPAAEALDTCAPCRYAPQGQRLAVEMDEEGLHLPNDLFYPGGHCLPGIGLDTTGGEETTGGDSTTTGGNTSTTGGDTTTSGDNTSTSDSNTNTSGDNTSTSGDASASATTSAGETPTVDDGCACNTPAQGRLTALAPLFVVATLGRRRRRRRAGAAQ